MPRPSLKRKRVWARDYFSVLLFVLCLFAVVAVRVFVFSVTGHNHTGKQFVTMQGCVCAYIVWVFGMLFEKDGYYKNLIGIVVIWIKGTVE